jgi:hypothetical protein
MFAVPLAHQSITLKILLQILVINVIFHAKFAQTFLEIALLAIVNFIYIIQIRHVYLHVLMDMLQI